MINLPALVKIICSCPTALANYSGTDCNLGSLAPARSESRLPKDGADLARRFKRARSAGIAAFLVTLGRAHRHGNQFTV